MTCDKCGKAQLVRMARGGGDRFPAWRVWYCPNCGHELSQLPGDGLDDAGRVGPPKGNDLKFHSISVGPEAPEALLMLLTGRLRTDENDAIVKAPSMAEAIRKACAEESLATDHDADYLVALLADDKFNEHRDQFAMVDGYLFVREDLLGCIARIHEALEAYADEGLWEDAGDGLPQGIFRFAMSGTCRPKEIARAALASVSAGKGKGKGKEGEKDERTRNKRP